MQLYQGEQQEERWGEGADHTYDTVNICQHRFDVFSRHRDQTVPEKKKGGPGTEGGGTVTESED